MIDCEGCSPGKLTGLWDLKRKKVNAEFVRMSLTPQKRVLFLHQQRAMAQSLRFTAHFPFLFFPVHLFQADYIVILDTSLQMLNKIQEFKITICRIQEITYLIFFSAVPVSAGILTIQLFSTDWMFLQDFFYFLFKCKQLLGKVLGQVTRFVWEQSQNQRV